MRREDERGCHRASFMGGDAKWHKDLCSEYHCGKILRKKENKTLEVEEKKCHLWVNKMHLAVPFG